MTTEENKIEEAAHDIAAILIDGGEYDCRYSLVKNATIELAKSNAAKEYHSKGMCTKEDVLSFFEKYEPNLAVTILKSEFVEWFDKNKSV